MKRFTDAVKTAIAQRNWYCALTLALTLPEICANLEFPKTKSGERYTAWWDKYGVASLQGGVAYALRCVYLHEGGDHVSEQKAQKVLTNFMFTGPRGNMIVHTHLYIGGPKVALQLQVDLFCNDICKGVYKWIEDTKDDVDVKERLKGLLTIKDVTGRP